MASITPSTKIVLITGANTGIGFAIAKLLTSEHKDYHVLLGSRSASKGEAAASELQKLGLSVEPIQIDITDDSSITTAASTVKSKFGRLDVLLNNAGIAPDEKDLSEPSQIRSVYTQMFNTNVIGHAVVTEVFTPLLDASTSPNVIFMSSAMGSLGTYEKSGQPFLPVYRSSKSALNMLFLSCATQNKAKGWRVNACCPGYVATALNHFAGTGTVESGAINAVRLVVEEKGTGTFSKKEGPIPW